MSYSHITANERYVISHLRAHGLSIRGIGRRPNRSHSTISRELKRNRPGGGVYWYQQISHLPLARKKLRDINVVKTINGSYDRSSVN